MNRARIEPTKFENVSTGKTSLGIRVYDSYGQSYDNTWDSIPDDDMDILAKAMKSEDRVIVAILDSLRENFKGIYIGYTWYTWEQIGHLWGDRD